MTSHVHILPSIEEWLTGQRNRIGLVGRLARGEQMSPGQIKFAIEKATNIYCSQASLLRQYDVTRKLNVGEDIPFE